MKHTIIVAIALIFLVGCQAIHVARLATAASKVKNCKYEIQESTEYLSILGNGHYLAKLDGKNLILPTEPQLADTSYPSDEEVNKLILIQNKVAQCRVGAIESFANVEPGVIPTLVEGYKQADERELNLIAKKTTWGEYAKQCVQNYNYSLPKFQKAFLEADRVREREADETMETVGNITGKIFSSTLQVALAALSAWSTQQQAMYRDYQSINNTNRFLFTDCTARKLGSSESISCSTH